MSAAKPHQLLQRLPTQSIVPAIAGCTLLCGSFLPWLNDPVMGRYSAWKLSVDIGWQFRSHLFSYGLLCVCCAALAFFTAYLHLRAGVGVGASKRTQYFALGYRSLGILCMVPFILFLLQYLFVDVEGIDVLAQHMIQALLIRQHFGYSVASMLIPLSPFRVTTATFMGRLALLVDVIFPGPFVSLVAGWMLMLPAWSGMSNRCAGTFVGTGGWVDEDEGAWCLSWWRSRSVTEDKHKAPSSATAATPCPYACQEKPTRAGIRSPKRLLMPLACLLLIVALGRAPAALAFEYLAKSSLAAGDSLTAMQWLDFAQVLNPALDKVSYYHIARGQAAYALHPNEQSDDSRAYLAFVYRGQGDNLDAEQELFALWHAHPTTPWVVDELSITLETLAEFIQQPNGPPLQRADNDIAAMTWLQILAQTDASNVYGQYLVGRTQYYLHSYSACVARMTRVIQLSRNPDIQSSAYTYMGLSMAGQSDIVSERRLLLEAVKLDPSYHNNTAREELSGLH